MMLLRLLTGILLLRAVVRSLVLVRRCWGHHSLSTSEVHVDPTGIVLGGILEPELLADLLNARFDFLDVVDRVVSLTHDPGEMDPVSSIHFPLIVCPCEKYYPRHKAGYSKHTRASGSVHAPWHI